MFQAVRRIADRFLSGPESCAGNVRDLPVPDLSRCPNDAAKVFAALLEKSPCPRSELYHRTGLSGGELEKALQSLSEDHGTMFVLCALSEGKEATLDKFFSGKDSQFDYSIISFADGVVKSREQLRKLIQFTGLRKEHVQPGK